MPEKDPLSYSMLTYAWVFVLSSWGGIVSFSQKIQNGVSRPFNITELLGEIATSAFAGLLTFYLCEASATPPLLSAALVGISGHMGSRAIFQIERLIEQRFNPKKTTGDA